MTTKYYVANDNQYELEKAKKPYGHKQYQRKTPSGKMAQVPAKGVKPTESKYSNKSKKTEFKTVEDLEKEVKQGLYHADYIKVGGTDYVMVEYSMESNPNSPTSGSRWISYADEDTLKKQIDIDYVEGTANLEDASVDWTYKGYQPRKKEPSKQPWQTDEPTYENTTKPWLSANEGKNVGAETKCPQCGKKVQMMVENGKVICPLCATHVATMPDTRKSGIFYGEGTQKKELPTDVADALGEWFEGSSWDLVHAWGDEGTFHCVVKTPDNLSFVRVFGVGNSGKHVSMDKRVSLESISSEARNKEEKGKIG